MNQFIQDCVSKKSICYDHSNFLTFGFPNCMMTATTLTTFFYLINESQGEQGLNAVKKIAKEQVKSMIQIWFPKGFSTNQDLDLLMRYLQIYGYGEFSIEQMRRSSKEIIFKQKNSVICMMNKKLFGTKTQPINAFAQGICAGIAEKLLNEPCSAKETSCVANLKECCYIQTATTEGRNGHGEDEDNDANDEPCYGDTFLLKNIPKDDPAQDNVQIIAKVEGHQMMELTNGMMMLMKVPGYVIPCNTIAFLTREFEREFPDGNALLHHCARIQSREAVTMQVKRFGFAPDKKLFLSILEHNGMTGYGLAQLKHANFEEKTAQVLGKYNSIALQYNKAFGRSKIGTDYYMAGLIRGMCEAFFGDAMRIEERKCVSFGDSNCLFELTPNSEEQLPIDQKYMGVIEKNLQPMNFIL